MKLTELPPEVLSLIFGYCPDDVLTIQHVCKLFYTIYSNPRFWRSFVEKRYIIHKQDLRLYSQLLRMGRGAMSLDHQDYEHIKGLVEIVLSDKRLDCSEFQEIGELAGFGTKVLRLPQLQKANSDATVNEYQKYVVAKLKKEIKAVVTTRSLIEIADCPESYDLLDLICVVAYQYFCPQFHGSEELMEWYLKKLNSKNLCVEELNECGLLSIVAEIFELTQNVIKDNRIHISNDNSVHSILFAYRHFKFRHIISNCIIATVAKRLFISWGYRATVRGVEASIRSVEGDGYTDNLIRIEGTHDGPTTIRIDSSAGITELVEMDSTAAELPIFEVKHLARSIVSVQMESNSKLVFYSRFQYISSLLRILFCPITVEAKRQSLLNLRYNVEGALTTVLKELDSRCGIGIDVEKHLTAVKEETDLNFCQWPTNSTFEPGTCVNCEGRNTVFVIVGLVQRMGRTANAEIEYALLDTFGRIQPISETSIYRVDYENDAAFIHNFTITGKFFEKYDVERKRFKLRESFDGRVPLFSF
jgi:hypothetical protein